MQPTHRRRPVRVPRSRLPGGIFAALLLMAPSLGAQQVTGRIVDQATGQPIASVQVSIPGSGIGALSQQSGRYLLLNVPVGTQTVSAQRIGYRTATAQVTVTAGSTVVQDFTLSEEALGLDEIVVTGTAGGGRQREVGASVSRLGSEMLETSARADIGSALQGRAGGLTVTSSSGQPGSAGKVVMRGTNSITQGSNPLIYVDGVRIFSGTRAGGPSGYQEYSALGNIRPQDIERVEIVRGPAATTLYGTEASDGVIQIFTKRGLSGAAQWNAEITSGLHTIGHVGPSAEKGNPDGLGHNQCIDRVTSTGIVFSDVTCPVDGDWIKPASIQRYNLGVTGGTTGMTYAVSLNYRDEGTPIDGSSVNVKRTGFTRDGGARVNFMFQLAPTLTAQWNSALNGGNIKWFPEGTGTRGGWSMAQTRGPYGTIFQDGKPATALAFLSNAFDKRKQTTSGLTIEHKVGDRFNQRLVIGYDVNQNTTSYFAPLGYWGEPSGEFQETEWSHWTTSFDYGATFKAKIGMLGQEISSTTSAGFQAAQDVDKRVSIAVLNFPAPVDVPTLTFGSTRSITNDSRLRVIAAGFFFQQLFGFKDQLFVTTGVRVDGNSAFGESFGMQLYPKISASYILSDLGFWPKWSDSFKLRAAMGEAGKAPGAFDAVRSWSPIAADEGKPAFTPGALGDPNLGPERTREYELGFDASFLEGRITSEVNLYHQTTLEALVPVSSTPSLGFSGTQLRNIGTLQNKGFEITVDAQVVRGQKLQFAVGGSYSLAKNEAIDLDRYVISLSTGVQVREGYPVPSFFAWEVTNPNEKADPVFNKDAFIGSMYADRSMNLRSTLGILGVRVTGNGEFSWGGHMQNQTSRLTAGRDLFGPCYPAQQAQRKALAGDPSAWKEITALMRAKCSVVPTEQRLELWYESTDFFKIRSVNLSYDLPEGLIPGTQRATLNLTGNNLWTRTDYWGTDPESSRGAAVDGTTRSDYNMLPPYTTYTASLSIGF